MRSHLFALASDAYEGQAVGGAVVAHRERRGAPASVLMAVVGVGLAAALSWPMWVGAALGAGLAATTYSMLTDTFVLVLLPGHVRVHRTPRFQWLRVPLGSYERDLDASQIARGRRGIINEIWRIGADTMRISRSDGTLLTEYLARRAI